MMTKQEIEAFLCQYSDFFCVKMNFNSVGLIKPLVAFIQSERLMYKFHEKFEYIELRSIDSLTDEEALEIDSVDIYKRMNDINDACYGMSPSGIILDGLESSYDIMRYESDYLRSIGIAVSFRVYTVEQMIEQGILKLK